MCSNAKTTQVKGTRMHAVYFLFGYMPVLGHYYSRQPIVAFLASEIIIEKHHAEQASVGKFKCALELVSHPVFIQILTISPCCMAQCLLDLTPV
jgi:hypothetical protein